MALALRLLDLGRQELWVDEGITWHFARLLGDFELGKQLRLEPTPPLYYGLIGLLLRLFGDSDLVLRLPSAIFGALAVPLVALLGERLGQRRAGLMGGLLLAVHPLQVFLSREARVYPLLLLLFLGLAWWLWQALDEGDWAAWLKAGAVLVLCLYSHLFGLFIGAAVALTALLLARDAASRWRGLATVAGAFLLFAPYLALALPSLVNSGANWSQELLYDALPQERGLPRIFEGQLIGADYHLLQRELARPQTPPQLRWPAVAAQVLLLLAAAVPKRHQGAVPRRFVGFLALLYLVPFLLPWAVGALTGKFFFQPGRHDVFVLGPLCLLLGIGFENLRARARLLAFLLLLPLLAGATFRLGWLHVLPESQARAERGRYLAAAAAPEDLAICFGIEALLAERYTRLSGGQVEFSSFPAETNEHPGWSDPRPLLRRLPELELEASQRLRELARSGRRIFTVERYPPGYTGNRLPGWEVDEAFIAALRAAGWRLESSPPDLAVRVWKAP